VRRALATFGAALALGTGACASPDAAPETVDLGGDGTAASPTPGSPRGGSSGGRVDPRRGGFEIGFGEYVVTLEAGAIRPGPVTFVIRNGGALVHGFEMEIEGEDDSSGSGSGDDDGFKVETGTIDPGETIELDLDLAPGLYKVECFIEGHDDLGMEALLEVRPDAPKVRRSAPSSGGDAVSIQGFAFDPAELAVGSGDEITWTNDDPAPHTVTARDGSFDSGTIEPGQSFAVQVDGSGAVTYFCEIHPTMEGTIRVG